MFSIRSQLLVSFALSSILMGSALAQQADENLITGGEPPAQQPDGISGIVSVPLVGSLFAGTATNSIGGLHDVFLIDPNTDSASSILTQQNIWGATADSANQRILFTTSTGSDNGDQLYAIPYAGGAPTLLGTITDGAAPQRMDGLAISNGVLYGSYAGAESDDGLWQIDLTTLVATSIAPFTDSVSGIDADPMTGTIYGVNDTTQQLVSIATNGTMTNIAAYPNGETDIDGLAVAEGKAYLVTDQPGSIYVYDLVNNVYLTPLTSPFTQGDTFSGAAFAVLADAGINNRATFAVNKIFDDGNDIDEVTISIDCNTGLILDQDKIVGNGDSVEFVVTAFTQGSMNCSITEGSVTAGYEASYEGNGNFGGCSWSNITNGTATTCTVTNSPVEVEIEVSKNWVIEGDNNDVDLNYTLRAYCSNIFYSQEKPISHSSDRIGSDSGTGPNDKVFTFTVKPGFPSSDCYVSERNRDSSIEVSNGCTNLNVSAGKGAACSITNTVFFEGIPTLNQYGMALLALLMLSVGFVSFRRFI